MTIEEGLVNYVLSQSGVTALIGTRIAPAPLRQESPLPAITYQLISVEDGLLHDGPLGLPQPRIQMDCWSSSYAGAKALAAAVKVAIHAYKGLMGTVQVEQASVVNLVDSYEPNTGKWRVIVDTVIQYKE